MSEYWKSTPKYWCKHCKTYVRDTKLEKQNHEASPKHQGNLKRFLRDLHRGHEKEERDKERAKAEVERVNGVVSGTQPLSSTAITSDSTGRRRAQLPTAPPPGARVTPEERKRQLAQLAEMGVSIPEEDRPEMAMSGEWQTVSQTIIHPTVKEEEDVKPGQRTIGVRKRKNPGLEDEQDEVAGETTAKRHWGSTIKTYSGLQQEEDASLEALLSGNATSDKLRNVDEQVGDERRKDDNGTVASSHMPMDSRALSKVKVQAEPVPGLKREPSDTVGITTSDLDAAGLKLEEGVGGAGVKLEEGVGGAVVFKKRKPKPVRQR